MPRLRTAVALLFQLLLLQVSVLGGGLACATDATAPVAARTAAPGGAHPGAHADAHAHHAASAGASVDHGSTHGATAAERAPAHDAPRHHDGAPSHCATAPGCAAVAVATVESGPDALVVVRSAALPGRMSRPASTNPAPEPPPPRA